MADMLARPNVRFMFEGWYFLVLTSNTANALHDAVNHFLSNGVVATGIVVGGILLSADQQFGVEELSIGASSDLINGRRVKIHKDGSRNVLATAGLGEESLVRTRVANILRIGVGAAIRTKAMLEKVAISTMVRDIVLPSTTQCTL